MSDLIVWGYRILSWAYTLFLSLLFLEIVPAGKSGLKKLRPARLLLLCGILLLTGPCLFLLYQNSPFSAYLLRNSPFEVIFLYTVSDLLKGSALFSLRRLMEKGGPNRDFLPVCLSVAAVLSFFLLLLVLIGKRRGDIDPVIGSWLLLTELLIAVLFVLILLLLNFTEKRHTEQLMFAYRKREENRRADELQTLYRGLREIRHDILNHYGILENMIQEGRTAAAEAYVRELKEALPHAFMTGCMPLDSELTVIERKLREKQVEFRTDLCFPEKLPLSDTEFCSVISNLLNNAEEELTEHPLSSGTPFISLTVRQVERMLLIRCENPTCSGHALDFARAGMSSKGQGHGLGLRIVRRTVEKAGGAVQLTQENGRFTVTISLPL